MIHFLGIVALLFVANALFSGDEREVIVVDAATRAYLIQQQQDLLLRDMTDAEKAELVADFIDEEILVREARKRGLENSSRIRALLLQNMRFFLAGEVAEPSEEELRGYFAEHIERFTSPPSITFDQVFFSDPDGAGPDTLERLRGGADFRALGDNSILMGKRLQASAAEVIATFGRDQAPAILALDDGHWHGPLTSINGVHFLRVVARHPGARPSFETARDWLRHEWTLTRRREIVERALAEMRTRYRIEVLQPEPDS